MAVDVRINGADYPDVPAIDVPKTNNGGTATFYDCSGDTAFDAQVLNGRTYHNANGKRTGTMTNRGYARLNISDKNAVYLDGSGYYSGGWAQITLEEQLKIVSENIKAGVTILGVAGSLKAGVDFDDMFNHSNTQSISSSPSADNTDKVCYGFYAGFNLDLTGFRYVADYAFMYAGIRSFTAPDLTRIGYMAFYGNGRLQDGAELTLPALTETDGNAFSDCNSFESVRLPLLPRFKSYDFHNCGYLKDVWLGYDGVVGMPASNATTVFEGCGRNSYSGDAYFKVHVPAAQLSAYQADQDWTLAIQSLINNGVNASIVGDYE